MNETKERKRFYPGLRKLLVYASRHKLLFSIIMLTLTAVAASGILFPIISANIVTSITESKFKEALYFAIAMLGVGIFLTLSKLLQNFVSAKIVANVKLDLRDSLISAITRVTMSASDKTSSGVYITRISEDVNRCSDVMIDLVFVFVEVIGNFAFLIYIAYINIYFFFAFVLYIAVLWFLNTRRENIWIKDRKKIKELSEISTTAYNEQIRGIRDIKSLNIRKNTIKDSYEKLKNTMNQFVSARYRRARNTFYGNFSAVIIEALFIVMGVLFIMNDMISLTNFLIIYIYHGNIKLLTQYIATIKEYSAEGELSAVRLFAIIDEFPKEVFGERTLENVVGNVKIDNVNFEYEENKPVLRGVSAFFEAGKATAIVGKSGSGKSTILSLINKLYKVQSGKVYIDDVDIDEFTEDSLRDNVGIVTQSPYIFHDSIRENLLFVKADATEEEMIDALSRAQIYDFVKDLPKGLDSRLGENGVMLSGGQKQRFAISRILLKNSKIIILDEATSALDNENQSKIIDVIDSLKKNHTIIVVAHRLSSIVDLDKIIVIDQGRVIGEGTHAQLMNSCPLYKELYTKEEQATKFQQLIGNGSAQSSPANEEHLPKFGPALTDADSPSIPL